MSGPHLKLGLDGRRILSPDEYEAEIVRITALYGMEIARQSVAMNYLKAESTRYAPEDDAGLEAWVQANPEGKERWRSAPLPAPEEPAPAPKPRSKAGLRPMNHTLRNLMPMRARQAFTTFEGWADPEGRFYCSPQKLAALVTGKPTANKNTGRRLLSLHLAAEVIRPDKKGKGAKANTYRLVRLIDHELASRVYREYRTEAREQMRALGFKCVG